MNNRLNRRSAELQRKLAARFCIPEAAVSAGVAALMESIRGRLPLGVEVCLASWMPDSWQLVSRTTPRNVAADSMSPEEIKAHVVKAGIPDRMAKEFIGAVFQFIEERLGKPLVTAIRRRVPELEEFDLDSSRHSLTKT